MRLVGVLTSQQNKTLKNRFLYNSRNASFAGESREFFLHPDRVKIFPLSKSLHNPNSQQQQHTEEDNMISSSQPKETKRPRKIRLPSPVIVSDTDQTERSSKKRKISEETNVKEHSLRSVPTFSHYLANQTLYDLLQRFNLPLNFVDDPIFQQFLLVVRMAGVDYCPTANTVAQDNFLVIALSTPEILLPTSAKK